MGGRRRSGETGRRRWIIFRFRGGRCVSAMSDLSGGGVSVCVCVCRGGDRTQDKRGRNCRGAVTEARCYYDRQAVT